MNLVLLDNIQVIEFIQHKTNKPTITPLINNAKELIPDMKYEEQKVFDVKSNQDTNVRICCSVIYFDIFGLELE